MADIHFTMSPAKFERQNHTIKDLETGHREVFDSINAAKRWSANKQRSLEGELGFGSVRVAV